MRTYARAVHRTIRVAVDDFSRCPGSYSSHASALNLAGYYDSSPAIPLYFCCTRGHFYQFDKGLFEWRSQLIPVERWAGLEPAVAAWLHNFAVSEPYGSHFIWPLSYHLTTTV